MPLIFCPNQLCLIRLAIEEKTAEIHAVASVRKAPL